MKKTTKTNKQVKQTKRMMSKRPILGKCASSLWFRAENARPKTIVATLERSDQGYRIVNSLILVENNQYTTKSVRADARSLVQDIRNRGIYSY